MVAARDDREQPARVAELIRDLMEASEDDLEAGRQAAIASARGRLDASVRPRFDSALAFAELVYPIREDNIVYTDSLPGGLIRRAALEIGRRLVSRGRLGVREDVAYLELDELVGLGASEDFTALADRRRREMAWVRAHRGPSFYGKREPPPPDIRGLPEAARRLNGAILWAMQAEMTPPPPPAEGEALAGIGASPGTYTGRVRVVEHDGELFRLRSGEVLVCPITTPAWAVYFSRAGALVTDGGSVLSHAAIIAREHGVPAVVATSVATTRLKTGMTVTVDGRTGAVTVHA